MDALPHELEAMIAKHVLSSSPDGLPVCRSVSSRWERIYIDAVLEAEIDALSAYLKAMSISIRGREVPKRWILAYSSSKHFVGVDRSDYVCARCGGTKRELMDRSCCKRRARVRNVWLGPLVASVAAVVFLTALPGRVRHLVVGRCFF